mgnify:CR=1 FL=1
MAFCCGINGRLLARKGLTLGGGTGTIEARMGVDESTLP